MNNNYCDRCGALGKTRYVLESGDLIFCGHHSRAYQDTLDEQGASIDFAFDLYDPGLVNA